MINQKVKTVNEKELETLKFWEDKKIFEKSLEIPAGEDPKGNFNFYDGPPFATGLPHHGHILAGTIKDVVARYQTMKGNYVRRVWGWDCHGLPIENMVEKELNFKHKKDIEEFGIKNFVEKAKGIVFRYEQDWKKIIPRFGRWVDMENSYKTMDTSYTESVWWSFKTLYDKGLIFESYKVMHICPRCETTLAQSEVNMPGAYKDLTDISVIVKMELVDEAQVFLLPWTTTPWTLPGNTGLAINKDFDYLKIKVKKENQEKQNEESYIFAKGRLEFIKNILEKDKFTFEITEEFKGEKLIGKKYKPCFDVNLETIKSKDFLKNKENIYKIWHADFISLDMGTGIAHQAPAFGSEDFSLAKEFNFPTIHHVNLDGGFVKEVNRELLAKNIIDEKIASQKIIVKTKEDNQATDILLIKYLAATSKLFAKEKIIHPYPTCWRCETPLLNYATSSWFMDVPTIKEKIISENKKILWVPEHIQNGRFGKWLEGAREWGLSRQRYWGAPIPVWVCENENCKKEKVIGSIAELGEILPKNDLGEIDLHRPYVDEIKFKCVCGSKMTRVFDVFDCWYESGAMPFASIHYPFSNVKLFENNFPADFIAEGLDQTRGWFYSLLNLSVGLFEKTSFKNCIVNGLVMAGDEKMSKSKSNYTSPLVLVEKYGADSFRHSLLASPLLNGENVNFPDSLVEDSYKKVVAKMDNILSFYELLEHSSENKKINKADELLNQWIFLRLTEIIEKITKNMDEYRLDLATRNFEKFVDDFSVWWLRRNREKLKLKNKEALTTFYYVLNEFSKLIAPFMPFLAERIYQSINLNNSFKKESVHLEPWPKVKILENNLKQNLLLEMTEVRDIVTELLMIRQKNNLPVRQPLLSATILTSLSEEYFEIISAEANVKEIKIGNKNDLDLNITSELKREGEQRELARLIKDKRKDLGLVSNDEIVLTISESKKSLLDENYLKEMKIRDVKYGENILIEKII